MVRFGLLAAVAALTASTAGLAVEEPRVSAKALAAWEKVVDSLEARTYAKTGKPLFDLDPKNAKAVSVGGLQRWRATADSVVFQKVPVPDAGADPAAKGDGIAAALFRDENRLQGADPEGRIRLFAPSEVDLGSSISHWDAAAFPNLLMEPGISADLPALDLDITPEQMFDIGWTPGTSSYTVFTTNDGLAALSDQRPFAGAPGNDATTLGQARRNVIEAALEVWGAVLGSPVNIDVLVDYEDQTCGDDGVTLAGATSLFQFSSTEVGALPRAGVLYPGPLAEALAGEDLTGPVSANGGDIFVTVNRAVDEGCAGAGTGYYYGLDGNEGQGQFDFLPVILHEIGHGLGFQNFTNELSGVQRRGIPSVYDLFTFDRTLGKSWAEMTVQERRFSTTNDGNVVWTGASVDQVVDGVLQNGVPVVNISGSRGADGDYDVAFGSIGTGPPDVPLTGSAGCLRDEVEELLDGCEPTTEDLTGQIAFVRRGQCLFTLKAENAQAAGATALLIVNNAGENGVPPGGTETIPLTIPVAGMGQTDGEAILAEVCQTETAARRVEPFLEVDSNLACPGFYIGEVEAIDSEGRWDMEILLTEGRRLLQGGLNLGGGFQGADRPGFAAFNITNANNEPQAVDINLEVAKPEGMRWRFEIERRDGNVAETVFFSEGDGTALQVTEVLEPGFYVVQVFGIGLGVTPSQFTLALETRFVDRAGGAFQGGVNLGGFMTAASDFSTSTGFGALCIDEAQTVSFETSGIGDADGVANLQLRVLDAARNVVVRLP